MNLSLNNRLFEIFSQVATDSLQIEVRNLKKAAELSHCFQTIDQVKFYCESI